jgi:ribonuclease HII
VTVSLERECALWDAGARVVAGIDEVGRGALAGPVSVGVVAVTRCQDWPLGLADSKELSRAQRESLCPTLASFGVARAVGHASAGEIDAVGIIAALRLAALRALAVVGPVDAVILDGKHDWLTVTADLLDPDPQPTPPVTMVIKGDSLCASVAAASVLAKVERDALMREAHATHPDYGWEGNKGYGAALHLDAIRRLGATEWHRRSWSLPVLEPA